MVASIVLKKSTKIGFLKIELNTRTGKLKMKAASYNMNSDEAKLFANKRRVVLPCMIVDDIATFYIPIEWDGDAMENYTQALMDELYLNKKKLEGCKTIEEIEKSFVLEVIIL